MTQEQKELLFKDLCCRLPYFTKVQIKNEIVVLDSICDDDGYHFNFIGEDREGVNIENIKPYLFPLSSMTEEQYKKWCDLEEDPLDDILTKNANGIKMSTLEHHLLIAKSLTDSVNYCYENHFDVYGLISKGLAIDATGKDIY